MFAAFDAAVTQAAALAPELLLFAGGKSMGGRIASLRADELYERGQIKGLVCLGYPFHPVKKPESLRTAHLVDLACPALFVHGERDPFGSPEEIAGYGLSGRISLCWSPDGDHDLRPRKSSGRNHQHNIQDAAEAIASFVGAHARAD